MRTSRALQAYDQDGESLTCTFRPFFTLGLGEFSLNMNFVAWFQIFLYQAVSRKANSG